jgi:PPOX class probable F420-dependent enzyme
MLNDRVHAFIETGPLAHVVTLGADGAPRVTLTWVGIDGDELVIGTLYDKPMLRNLRRDPRIALSFVTGRQNGIGLEEYLVVNGTARITEGGAARLLGTLATTYIGPEAVFPPVPDPPPGFVTRITVDRVSGNGPWGTGAD